MNTKTYIFLLLGLPATLAIFSPVKSAFLGRLVAMFRIESHGLANSSL